VRAFVGDCLIENYPSVIRIVDGLKLIITTPELSKDYAKGLLEHFGLTGNEAIQLIDLYDEHLKHLNQQK
jgi:hypothetical protein